MARSSKGLQSNSTGIFATGPAGNGKTTFLELLEELFRPKFGPTAVCRIDMSQIFSKWGMRLTDELGEELRTYIPVIKGGRFVPDEPTIRTFNRWLEEVLRTTKKRIFLFGGFPRTPEQLVGLNRFTQSIVLYRPTNKEQSDAAILKRWKESEGKQGSELRMENPPTSEQLQIRWDEAQATAAAMERLGDQCLNLSPTANLRARLSQTLATLAQRNLIPAELIQRANDKLNNPNHIVRLRIREIEGTTLQHEESLKEKDGYQDRYVSTTMQLSAR